MKKYLKLFILALLVFVIKLDVAFAIEEKDLVATCEYNYDVGENTGKITIYIKKDYSLDFYSSALSAAEAKYASIANASAVGKMVNMSYQDYKKNGEDVSCENVPQLILTLCAAGGGRSYGEQYIISKDGKVGQTTGTCGETTYKLDMEHSRIYSEQHEEQELEEKGWISICHYGYYYFKFNSTEYETNIDFDIVNGGGGHYSNTDEPFKDVVDNGYTCPGFLCGRSYGARGYNVTRYYFSTDNTGCTPAVVYGQEYTCGIINNLSSQFLDAVEKKDYSGISDSKYKTSIICNSIMGTMNYDDSNSCVKDCLEFSKKVKSFDPKSLNDCGFSDKLSNWIINIIKWIKYILPVIVIILGILDFIKAMGSEKEDEMKKAQNRFVKRLIAAALVFLVPFIIEFILEKMGFVSNSCGFW